MSQKIQEAGTASPTQIATQKQERDLHAAPDWADLSYISPGLRPLAVLIDSLVLDDANVKDHGEADLPTHAASLKQFGIRRAVVVQRSTRKIEAGNGSVQAAKRNGWLYVPVIFEDDDHSQAKAFALADNAVGTLASWNEANLAAAVAEAESLFDDESMRALMNDLNAQVAAIEEEQEASEETVEEEKPKEIKPEDISLSYRVIAVCANQEDQIKLLAELENRGMSCKLSTIRITEKE